MARSSAPPRVLDVGLLVEAQRQFDVCNACRYCEGLCAVFPALERRSLFTEGDVLFLANLCHDCRSCLDACPYAPPHEFSIDIPPLMSAIREQTYQRYARPRAFGRAMLEPNRLRVAISFLILAICVALALGIVGGRELLAPRPGPGAFYEVVPFAAMTIPAFVLSGLSFILMCVGVAAFWRDTANRKVSLSSLWRSLSAALTLENMRGGGPGCTYPGERPENRRLAMHSLVFYGFSATFIATILAAIWQELLGELPPYPLLSPPVVVGTIGGMATIFGCVGLLGLKSRSRRDLDHEGIRRLDIDFIVLLMSINVTGLLLLLGRSTSAMGPLLVIHLGLIAALFATLPYGKFVHSTYRTAALVQDAVETKAGPNR